MEPFRQCKYKEDYIFNIDDKVYSPLEFYNERVSQTKARKIRSIFIKSL